MKFSSCLLLTMLVSSPLMAVQDLSTSAIMVDKNGKEASIPIGPKVDTLSETVSSNKLINKLTAMLVLQVKCANSYAKFGKVCITPKLYGSARYRYAEYLCRQMHSGGRIADNADYYSVYRVKGNATFHNYAIRGIWLGPRTADNKALYLNRVRWWDMDGQTSVFNFRYYRCAYTQ